jgi:hypothetical protein
MGNADYYAPGEWNFYCDLCGKKQKSSQGVKTWDNFWVCRSHREARNPQDFVKGVHDPQTVPWSRDQPPATYVPAWGNPIYDTYGNIILCMDMTPLLDVGT